MAKEYFKKQIYVLDGGFGSELERNGFSLLNDPLWSARVLHTNPEAVIKIHKSYLEHGADIITTASYQASLFGFQRHLGITIKKSQELMKQCVLLAKTAREEYSKDTGRDNILIAGSVGPYAAALADGSEYSGDSYQKFSDADFIEWHRPRIRCLVESGVDLLAFETIPALKEAEALMKLLAEFPDTKAWISFSSQSMHENSHGENIAPVAERCLNLAPNQLVAIGVNCCPPECAESLLKDIASVCPDFPLIVYPNCGEKWDTKSGWFGEKMRITDSFLKSWVSASAKVIGGCCRTTPEDIAKIREFVCKMEN